MSHKLKIAGWISVGALAGALTTVSLQTVARGSLAPLPLEELQQLAAVFGMVKSDYVEPVDEKKLITDAISGMVASLDPHSQYFDKKSFKEFREGTSGRFVGVGIEISQEDGLVKVVSPIEGSPAFRAGLKPNDLITKIDDTVVKGLTLNEAVKRMRGEPNTKVHADHLPQGREPHLPRDHHARGNPHAVGARQGDRAGLRLDSPVPVPGTHGRRLRQEGRGALQGRPQPQGPGAGPAQRPGRPARCGRRDFRRLPARERHRGFHQRPARGKQVRLQGLAGVLPAPRRCRPAAPPAGRAQDRCRWSCWSTKARLRPAKSSPARCRTTSAPPSWAARRSARARCRRCARSAPTPA